MTDWHGILDERLEEGFGPAMVIVLCLGVIAPFVMEYGLHDAAVIAAKLIGGVVAVIVFFVLLALFVGFIRMDLTAAIERWR